MTNDRHLWIGASEVAAVMNKSPWATPIEIWQEKIGLRPPKSMSGAMEWGLRLEEVVARKFCEVHHIDPNEIAITCQQQATDGHVRATVDYLLPDGISILEIKTASHYSAWTDPTDVPLYYKMQEEVQMELHGRSQCYTAVLKGGNDYRDYVYKSTRAGRTIVDYCNDWWDKYVETKDRPPCDAELPPDELFLAADIEAVEADNDIVIAHTRLKHLSGDKKFSREEEDQLKTMIKTYMGDAVELRHDGETLVTWKPAKPKVVTDWEAVVQRIRGEFDEEQIPSGLLQSFIDENSTQQKPSRRLIIK